MFQKGVRDVCLSDMEHYKNFFVILIAKHKVLKRIYLLIAPKLHITTKV